MTRFFLGVLAYVAPTFALGLIWHLFLFERYYAALGIYRSDIIIPFGFLSMLVQAFLFAWIYERMFARRDGARLSTPCLAPFCRGVSPHSPSRPRT